MNEKYSEEEIRKAIDVLKPNNQLYEVRVLAETKSNNCSGYFRGADGLLAKLKTINPKGANIYITLNTLDDNCYNRRQRECFVRGATSTSDTDVKRYDWLFIDMDPVRMSGISSSADEYEAAMEMARKIKSYMKSIGFYEPISAVSGNGAHLLYRIDLDNTKENEELIGRCLTALALLFNNEAVKVDEVNKNPSRICKLYGTVAQKGANTEERPHRLSKMKAPESVLVNSRDVLQRLADTVEPDPVQKMVPKSKSEFDIREWLDRYGISYREDNRGSYTKLLLEECPFNHDHKAPDSCIIIQPSGAFGFKCLHNSCRDKTWQDFRVLYEPDAYDRKGSAEDDKRIEEGYKEHNRTRTDIPYTEAPVPDDVEQMFLTAKMIADMPTPPETYIKTGIALIDRKMKGLKKGCISVVTGLRGASKSTWLSEVMLNAIESGQNVICYSGELTPQNFMKWMYLQAAGVEKVEKSTLYENTWYTSKETKLQIAEWLGERFWLYDNKYGSDFRSISNVLPSVIKRHKADLVVIDNLMALDLSSLSQDKYEAQTEFVLTLTNIAKLSNTHIVFVAHPRKAYGFLRLDDIGGSGNLSNAVDNAFIVHRVNEDFRRLTKEMFHWKDDELVYRATNVIEVAKNRDDGVQDEFIPLWYEPQTKRLKNNEIEHITYSWDNDGFISADQEQIPF